MAIHITLQLPEWLMERLAQASRDTSRSVQDVIVDALRHANFSAASPEDMTPPERWHSVMSESMVPWTDEIDALMAEVLPGDDSEPVLSHEELRAIIPRLDPPLSQTVSELREDRV